MRRFAILALLFVAPALLAQEALPPAKPVDPAEIARLIEQLDAIKFTEREQASAALAKIGKPATDALEKAVQETKSAELKSRGEAVLLEIRYQELRRNAFKLDAVYQMARDVCDGKAEAKDLEPLVDRILAALAAADPAAAKPLPIKTSEGELLVGKTDIGVLRRSTAVFDTCGHIDHAHDSVIVAWGLVDISHAHNCLVIAGGDVSIAHARDCIVLGGGNVTTSHASTCTLGAAELLQPGHLSMRTFLVNSRLPEPGLVRGRIGDITNMEVPGLILGEKPVMKELLTGKLTPTHMDDQFMIFQVPGQPGEFVARPGSELLDPFGKPAPGLEGWKLVLVTNRFAAFEKGQERTFMRWKRE